MEFWFFDFTEDYPLSKIEYLNESERPSQCTIADFCEDQVNRIGLMAIAISKFTKKLIKHCYLNSHIKNPQINGLRP